MKRPAIWVLVIGAIVAVSLSAISHRYVLTSADLEGAITRELPVGTPKAEVVKFIQGRHPLFMDDLGSSVKARVSGLAENMLCRKDVILTFDFDSTGRLVTYSKKEFLTFF